MRLAVAADSAGRRQCVLELLPRRTSGRFTQPIELDLHLPKGFTYEQGKEMTWRVSVIGIYRPQRRSPKVVSSLQPPHSYRSSFWL